VTSLHPIVCKCVDRGSRSFHFTSSGVVRHADGATVVDEGCPDNDWGSARRWDKYQSGAAGAAGVVGAVWQPHERRSAEAATDQPAASAATTHRGRRDGDQDDSNRRGDQNQLRECMHCRQTFILDPF